MSHIKFKNEYLNFNLGGCFVDIEKRFAFIHIFKNASISIRNALGMRGRYYDWEDVRYTGKKTICVIREPVKRFVSAYQYILRLHDGGGFPNKHPIQITKNTDFYKERKNQIKSFLLFLDYIEKNGFYDAVTVPQVHFLKARNLKIDEIDHVFIQEYLKEEFNEFCNIYQIENNLSIDNSGIKETTILLTNFIEENDNIKNRIQSLYIEDTLLYNKIKNRRYK